MDGRRQRVRSDQRWRQSLGQTADGGPGLFFKGVNEIRSAHVVLFYLFDVAETIDLQRIPGLIGGPTVAARLTPKQATPAYVQYDNPPVSFDGDAVGVARCRGVSSAISRLRLRRHLGGAHAAVQRRVERAGRAGPDADRERRLRAACRAAVPDHRGPAAARRSRTIAEEYLSEDYLVVRGPRARSAAVRRRSAGGAWQRHRSDAPR